MRKNVLVFPCGSEIGLEIYRSLHLSTHFQVFGGSSVEDHGAFVYKNYIGNFPSVMDPDFVDRINKIVDDQKIDFIIPAHDDVVLKLAQAKADGRLNCELITSDLKTCEIAHSKLKTYEIFKDIIPVPEVYKSSKDIQLFPVFLKPEVGQGTKGTFKAKDKQDVEFYKAKDPSLLILEYLPGKEYTVDCFTTKDGKLLFAEGRERTRILNGISVSSKTVKIRRFNELAEAINNELKFRGVWFFQVKENKEGELVLMEIAPRIAGTMGLVRARGVNLVLMSLFDAMGIDVSVIENSHETIIDRALENTFKHDIKYNHVYLDFDDLVIFEDKVNPAVMAFVYQCINKGIKVHLITRHKAVLDETLAKYHLKGVFDEQILVNDDDHKHRYIKEKDSIFIDDSFAERKAVHDNCHIPVFDSHMVESLLEKF
ncbi:carbamoylphosphate synthase large subunit short form [Candidatus Saccharibacteria bacterium RIFCSPHIGHO2_02_FULL_47_12]|nr:MAG: carbamoylphosphate synthase large subunit short form [Candidatus Saccharibacteria bacterium RIFCSPHIGHO2_02_FULL_47_12]